MSSRYQILNLISTSSWGEFYLGHDFRLRKDVGVLKLHEWVDVKNVGDLVAEASKIACPAILDVSNFEDAEGILILNGDASGGTARQAAQNSPVSPSVGRTILERGLEALVQLEKVGFTHGDVSPDTMLLPGANGKSKPRFDEFRLLFSPGVLWRGSLTPTRNHKYSAPEMLNSEFGAISPKSDVYCLAFSVLELMTGSKFDDYFSRVNSNDNSSWMFWHASVAQKLPPVTTLVPDVDDGLADLLTKMLERDAAKRPSATEALKILKSASIKAIDIEKIASKAKDVAKKPYVVWTLCSALVAFAVLAFAKTVVPPQPGYWARLKIESTEEASRNARVYWIDPSYEDFELPRNANGEWLFPAQKNPFEPPKIFRVESVGYESSKVALKVKRNSDGSVVCLNENKQGASVKLDAETPRTLRIKTKFSAPTSFYAQNLDAPGSTYEKRTLSPKNGDIELPKGCYLCAVYREGKRPCVLDGVVDLSQVADPSASSETFLSDKIEKQLATFDKEDDVKNDGKFDARKENVFQLAFFIMTSVAAELCSAYDQQFFDDVKRQIVDDVNRLDFDDAERRSDYVKQQVKQQFDDVKRQIVDDGDQLFSGYIKDDEYEEYFFSDCYNEQDETRLEEKLHELESSLVAISDAVIVRLYQRNLFVDLEDGSRDRWKRLETFCLDFDKELSDDSPFKESVEYWLAFASLNLEWRRFWLQPNNSQQIDPQWFEAYFTSRKFFDESILKKRDGDSLDVSKHNADVFLAYHYYAWLVALEFVVDKATVLNINAYSKDNNEQYVESKKNIKKIENYINQCWNKTKGYCDVVLENSSGNKIRESDVPCWKFRQAYSSLRLALFEETPKKRVESLKDCEQQFAPLLQDKKIGVDAQVAYVETLVELASLSKSNETDSNDVAQWRDDIERQIENLEYANLNELQAMRLLLLKAKANADDYQETANCFAAYVSKANELVGKNADSFFSTEFSQGVADIYAQFRTLAWSNKSRGESENSKYRDIIGDSIYELHAKFNNYVPAPISKRQFLLLNWNNSLDRTPRIPASENVAPEDLSNE